MYYFSFQFKVHKGCVAHFIESYSGVIRILYKGRGGEGAKQLLRNFKRMCYLAILPTCAVYTSRERWFGKGGGNGSIEGEGEGGEREAMPDLYLKGAMVWQGGRE